VNVPLASVSGFGFFLPLRAAEAVGISIVIVTGYTGQLALAPLALAGVGALIAVRLANAGHLPILMALLTSAVCSAVIGLLFALPALRTRGANLAIVTLSLGAVLNDVILTNYNYTGGESGITLSPPEIFGWSINPLTDLGRYASVAVLIFLAVVVAREQLDELAVVLGRADEQRH